MEIQEMDKNMLADNLGEQDANWYDPKKEPFCIAGFPCLDEDRVYRRLPLSAKEAVRAANPNVDQLSWNTAGGQIRFRSDSRFVCVRVKLNGTASLPHMAPTGECGFDCYAGENGAMIFRGCSKYDSSQDHYEALLCSELEQGEKEFILNFPLYMGVREVMVGLQQGSRVLPPAPFRQPGRVVAYGTSITQGGCASRPGMAYTNILSRRLGIEFVNLGFSGNGLGEAAVAKEVASVSETRLFLIDYEANAAEKGTLSATLPQLIDTIREEHPATDILVLSLFRLPAWLDPEKNRAAQLRRSFQADLVQSRREGGDTRLHFLNGERLLGEDWHECTVDGIHPTDLGFYRIAKALEAPIQALLDGES